MFSVVCKAKEHACELATKEQVCDTILNPTIHTLNVVTSFMKIL